MTPEQKSELDAAAATMVPFRPDQPFTDLEKALGLWAFAYWLSHGQMAKMGRPGDFEAHFSSPNVSARFAALSLADSRLDDPKVMSAIREQEPTFNPVAEFEMGANKSDAPEWKSSITRAMVMICRSLAYRYTGFMGTKSKVFDGVPDGKIRSIAIEMANDTLGKEVFS